MQLVELGVHDAASRQRVAHVWSRPMDTTLSVSEQPIGRTSDGGAGQRHSRSRITDAVPQFKHDLRTFAAYFASALDQSRPWLAWASGPGRPRHAGTVIFALF